MSFSESLALTKFLFTALHPFAREYRIARGGNEAHFRANGPLTNTTLRFVHPRERRGRNRAELSAPGWRNTESCSPEDSSVDNTPEDGRVEAEV